MKDIELPPLSKFDHPEPLLARIAELERHNNELVKRREFDVRDIKDSTAKLVALTRELEEARKDAGRYRWLCSHTIIPSPSLWDMGVAFATPTFPRKKGAMTKDELDASIDAAIKEQKK